MNRERAQAPAGGVAVAEHAPAPRNGSPVARSALDLQGSAGNGAVARLAAQGGTTAVLDPASAAGRAPEPVVPTGPIPETVPAASAAEARDAAPRKRSWWDRVKSAVSDALSSIGAGLGALTSRVLGAVAGRARQIPGYGLLTVALGKDVVTGQSVPRTAVNVVGGLVGLIPGGAALFANLQASGAVDRAAAWFGTAWGQLGLTWDYLRGLFRQAWDALGVRDLLDIAGAWAKLQRIFAPPMQRVLAFATAAGSKLLELVFEAGLGMAGPLGAQVMAIIRRGGAVLGTVFRDPIGFAGKLVAAVRGGLGQFAGRIGHHLKQGLFGWLTGALRGAITLPEKFDLRGILSLVLQLLGATWTWLRTRMVRLLGEERVALIERAVDWVQRIATEGLSAVWERIAEFATGLVDNVLDAIKEWVGRSVVGAAITKLVTMFNPAGAVIQAILAAYNTIKFFIERAQQLGALANAVFGSIGAIASGSLGNAMNAVENALSRALPVAISFLARLIGLGDVATPVRNLVERARGVIDKALDKVIGWLAALARPAVGGLRRGAARVRAGATGALAKVRSWFRLRAPFTAADGSRHTVYWAGTERAPELTVASRPAPAEVILRRLDPLVPRDVAHLVSSLSEAHKDAREVRRLRGVVFAHGPTARQASDVEALNLAMAALAEHLAPLMTLIDPKSSVGSSSFPPFVRPGRLIRIGTKNRVAMVVSISHLASHENIPQVSYQIIRPRLSDNSPFRGYSGPTGGVERVGPPTVSAQQWEEFVDDPRNYYMGPTPGKGSKVGREVIRRMTAEGRIRGGQVLSRYDLAGSPLQAGQELWFPLSACHMGHVVDAVTWWNSNGRFTGPQSAAVQAFMEDSENYELEYGPINSLRGASLNQTYKAVPPNATI